MRAPRAWIALAAAALLSAALAEDARADNAQDTAIARDLFREGAALAQQGKWDQALNRYARSLKLKRASLTLYSLGVAQKQLGQLIEARESFTAFLAEPSSTATQPFEEPAKAALEEINTRVGRLTIEITPARVAGLVVRLDGVTLPTSDLSEARPVNPGNHEITASGVGYARARVGVAVPDGGAITAAITLRPGDDAPPAPTAPSGPPPSERTFPMVLIGTGVSIFTTGAAIATLGLLEANNAGASDSAGAKNARSKEIIGGAVGGAGFIALGVGVILYLTQGPAADAPDPQTSVSVRPWAQGSAAGVQVTF